MTAPIPRPPIVRPSITTTAKDSEDIVIIPLKGTSSAFSVLLKDLSETVLGYPESRVHLASCWSVWLHRPKTEIDLRDMSRGWSLLSPGLSTFRPFLNALTPHPQYAYPMSVSRMFNPHLALRLPTHHIVFEPRLTEHGTNVLRTLALVYARPDLRHLFMKFCERVPSANKTRVPSEVVSLIVGTQSL